MNRRGRRTRTLGCGGNRGSLKLCQNFGMLKVACNAVLDAVATSRMNFIALSHGRVVSNLLLLLAFTFCLWKCFWQVRELLNTDLDLARLAPPAAGPGLSMGTTGRHTNTQWEGRVRLAKSIKFFLLLGAVTGYKLCCASLLLLCGLLWRHLRPAAFHASCSRANRGQFVAFRCFLSFSSNNACQLSR
jgi:hypothetical protein